MPLFSYKIVDGDGIPRDGVMTADSMEELLKDFRGKDYTVIQVVPDNREPSGEIIEPFNGLHQSGRISDESLVKMAAQFSFLFKSDISPRRMMSLVRIDKNDGSATEALEIIDRELSQGVSFSDALVRAKDFFGNLFTRILSEGRSGEDFSERARQLKNLFEENLKTAKSVRASVAYPLKAAGVAVLLSYILMTLFFPGFIPILEKSGADIAGRFPVTGAFIALCTQLTTPPGAYYIPGILLVFSAGLWILLSTTGGRAFLEKVLIFLPIGRIIRTGALVRFCRTFGVASRFGLLPEECFDLAVDASNSGIIMDSSEQVREYVKDGEKFFAAMEKTGVFPPVIVAGMADSSHRADRMEASADLFEDELTDLIEKRAGFCETAVILGAGLFLLLSVLAILLPVMG